MQISCISPSIAHFLPCHSVALTGQQSHRHLLFKVLHSCRWKFVLEVGLASWKASVYTGQHKNRKVQTYTHALCGIKTHCPLSMWQNTVRGGAVKSLAQPGRKQATATQLGIYSTYSPRSSIHFLANCSNFWKPLKKIQKFVHPTRSPQQR